MKKRTKHGDSRKDDSFAENVKKKVQESDEELYRRIFGENAEKMLKLTPKRKTDEELEAEAEEELEKLFRKSKPRKREEDKSFYDQMRDRASEYSEFGSGLLNGVGMVYPKIMNNHFRYLHRISKGSGRVGFLKALIRDLENIAKYEFLDREINRRDGNRGLQKL